MQIIDTQAMAWSGQEERHRVGALNFKKLFNGTEGDPNNFRLVLSRTDGEYRSPYHRHNFDQIRVCLQGKGNIKPGTDLHAGDVGYFPEGTFYGPQEDIGSQRVGLVLQFGGASGLGYMSGAQLRQGQEELEKVGVFANGRFTREGEPPESSRDSYEAIWEHVFDRPLEYPAQRYEEPVIIRPASFAWVADPSRRGVARKLLGCFTERGTRLETIRLDEDAAVDLGAPDALTLVFVLDGAGAAAETEWRKWSALRIEAGETATVKAGMRSELFVMSLPLVAQNAH